MHLGQSNKGMIRYKYKLPVEEGEIKAINRDM